MRAAELQDDGRVAVAETAEPAPGEGELVLAVLGAGVCGTDLHAIENGIPVGSVLGHELAGRVVAVGAGVDGAHDDDVVCAMPVIACGTCGPCVRGDRIHCANGGRLVGLGGVAGAFADYVTVGASESFRLPAGFDASIAALVEPLAVGLAAVERAAVQPDEAVVVIGGGPIGLAITVWLQVLGVGDVVVSDPVAGRRALAERCGATATVDPTAEPLVSGVRTVLGKRPDVVIEAAGAPATIAAAVDLAPYDARIVIAGLHAGPESLPASKAFHKNLSFAFSSWYRTRHFAHTVRLLEQGRLDPSVLVTHRVGLDGLPAAFDALRVPNDQGKVLVVP
ncbi:MAG TPA: alcohol dehydrogenase catalytic domain-containing protein [Acidimicrobiia bacterium]|nr:alcohol dehydrogenase catalytic domain-containing protein [Acidimicrobiia bacterium]